MLQNIQNLSETITSLSPKFNYNSVIIHLKNGASFQLILSGDLTDIVNLLISPSDVLKVPVGYNMVDTFTGCRIIYKIDELSHIEFKPDIEDETPLVYEIN